jgi:hypothetical protein
LLAQLSSRQLGEWMAFGTIEQIGNPVRIEDPMAKRKAKRAGIEAGLKSLMEKSNGVPG